MPGLSVPSGLGVTMLLEELEHKLVDEDVPARRCASRACASPLVGPEAKRSSVGMSPESPTSAYISVLCQELDAEAAKRGVASAAVGIPRAPAANNATKSNAISGVGGACEDHGGCSGLDDLIVQGFALLADGSHDGPQLLRVDRAALGNLCAKDTDKKAEWDFWQSAEGDDDTQSGSFGSTSESSSSGAQDSSM